MDKVPIRCPFSCHYLLSKAEEDFTRMTGAAAIETKRVLVQVPLQMLVADGPLVSTQEPAFEQGRHAMHSGQDLGGGAQGLAFELGDFMLITQLG